MDLIEELWEGFCRYFSKEPVRPVPDEIIEQVRLLQFQVQRGNVSEQRNEDELRKAFRDYEYLEKVYRASKELGIDYVRNFNFAICGQSGSGKSSLICALLWLRRRNTTGMFNRLVARFTPGFHEPEPEVPEVGEIECTMETTCYVNPKLAHLALWDLPGAGTARHPAETYYEDKALCAFDALLLVVNERFSETDLVILKKAKEKKKPIIVLQSKSDMHLKNKVEREMGKGLTMKLAAEELRKEKERSLRQQLSLAGMEENDIEMLMVSAFGFGHWDNPYIRRSARGKDKSLTKMDENRLLEYLKSTAATRMAPPHISPPKEDVQAIPALVQISPPENVQAIPAVVHQTFEEMDTIPPLVHQAFKETDADKWRYFT